MHPPSWWAGGWQILTSSLWSCRGTVQVGCDSRRSVTTGRCAVSQHGRLFERNARGRCLSRLCNHSRRVVKHTMWVRAPSSLSSWCPIPRDSTCHKEKRKRVFLLFWCYEFWANFLVWDKQLLGSVVEKYAPFLYLGCRLFDLIVSSLGVLLCSSSFGKKASFSPFVFREFWAKYL
jgi:hypothetical protein